MLEPVPIRTVPTRKSKLARFLSGPLTMRAAVSERPALIHVTCLDLLPWSVLVRLVTRIPVIYDSNDDYAAYMLLKEWVPKSLRPALSRIVGTLEPLLAGRLDATTVADSGSAELFAQTGRPVLVVPNYPWLDFARVDRADPPLHDIIYHGSLHNSYIENIIGTAQAMKALGLNPRWCLAARDFSDDDAEALTRRLEQAGLRDSFTTHYNLPFSAMATLLATARVGFIPLPDERKYHRNLPRKLFEYLASGMPVVASDLPPIRALVGDTNCCILCRPGDHAAYAGALADLLDSTTCEAMAEEGRALVQERWNAAKATSPYAELCRGLIGTSNA